MTRYFEAKHKGQRFSVSASWSRLLGWYRCTVTWYPSALNPTLPPLVQRYRGADSAMVAASLFGGRYDCL